MLIIKSDPDFKKRVNRVCWQQLFLGAVAIAPFFLSLPTVAAAACPFVVVPAILYLTIRHRRFQNERISQYLANARGS
jgi:hypothetical protein